MDARRDIPRTDAVLADPRLAAALAALGRPLVRAAVTAAADRARAGALAPAEVVGAALAALPRYASGLRPTINATGVLVHTNLGRAPLSAAARAAVDAAAGTVDIELDLATGRRAPRARTAVAALRAAVPDAADAHVVNNNAAALALTAAALAAGREIVVGRGELVEIGDGFRLPDLLTAAGARLREVGTTNRTRAADYAAALGPDTALILKVHPSNFRQTGFVAEASVAELAALGPPVVYDIGSGLLAPEPLLPDEPDAATALRAGAALVTASGDKLLGGPQCGLLLGRADLVAALRRHPLARALRVDKLTAAALEATLTGPPPPVAAGLRTDTASLRHRAAALLAGLGPAAAGVAIVDTDATVGGGGAPGVVLAGVALALPAGAAAPLRAGDPAVLGRVSGGRLLLDLRSVPPADDAALAAALAELGG
ncbi:L-seryl-tRNA(Sec) selenium transferase [Pilimelia anulata]|uniref:L-seryl-tRNA(Sec) selenium transferase n=1 Tax=Pilimelia anulata TaxID=53371 RepID=A0A8J3BBW8_9ACTN|nr:L-seryl-tRNA(Sec) selenium transferase [Pilimelia anulata]GGJ95425.1 L-seryl-tRNA(Sec) selenium transferase [Pilimelia anulata]